MNDILIPEWIRREKAAQVSEQLRTEALAQRQLAESLTVKAEAPAFLRQFIKELALNVESLGELNLRGHISQIRQSELEDAYRIEVALVGLYPRQTYTDIFLRGEGSVIRCHTLEGKSFQFSLCVRPEGGIGAFHDEEMMLMTPERTAEVIVKRMADFVRATRN